jgi:hypothetical protein
MSKEELRSKKLLRKNRELRRVNKILRKENERVKKELDQVKKEFEEYKMRHPETVGVKHGKPYFIRSTTKSSGHRRPGARPGHAPSFRPVPTKIDAIRQIPVTSCPYCGGKNLSGVQEERVRIVEDIPPCQPVVTRYVIERLQRLQAPGRNSCNRCTA